MLRNVGWQNKTKLLPAECSKLFIDFLLFIKLLANIWCYTMTYSRGHVLVN